MWEVPGGAHVGEAHFFRTRHGDDCTGCGFGEQCGEQVHTVAVDDFVQPDARTHAEAHNRFGHSDGQTALRKVVRGVDHAVTAGVDEDLAEFAFSFRLELRRQTAQVAVCDIRPGRTAEVLFCFAQQVDCVAGTREARRGCAGDVVENAHDADNRGGQDRGVARLVVQRHVAAGDGNAKSLASLREALNRGGQLPHDGGVFRRTEVEAVGHGHRTSAGGGDVAVGLGQCQLSAGCRIQVGVAAVGVSGQRNAQTRFLVDADDTGVVGECQSGVALHVAVVLVGDPFLRAQVG